MGEKGNPESAATLEEQVREVVKQMEVTEDGKVTFPKDVELSPEVKYAATLEHRRLSTQAAFTKGQQRLKALEAEKKLLEEKISSLSTKDSKELDELKYEDPDEWYKQRRALESRTKEELQQQLSEVGTQAAREAELARRTQVLEDFNQSHPEFQLTDEVIAYDVPPRLTKQLEEGKVSFEDFLEQVYSYLSKPKKVGTNNSTLDQPDLGKLGGGDKPTKHTTSVDIVESYKKEIF